MIPLRVAAAAALGLAAAACAAPPHAEVLPWSGWQPVELAAAGEIRVDGDALVLGAGGPLTAVRWTGAAPVAPYELEFDATRLEGNDFFVGLSFPAGDGHMTLVLGGWGGALCGLSCLDGVDAADNGTAVFRRIEQGTAYRVRVRVEADRVFTWLDGAPLHDLALTGRHCSLRTEVRDCAPLGLASYMTRARVGALTLRGSRGAERGASQ